MEYEVRFYRKMTRMGKIKRIVAKGVMLTGLALSMAGCGGNTGGTADRSAGQTSGVSDVLEERAAEEDAKTEAGTEEVTTEKAKVEDATEAEATTEEETTEEVASDDGADDASSTELETIVEPPKYDVDLTNLSSTMVYSEVYNMVMDPSEYMGKYIRMEGPFSVYTNPDTKKNYFACVIQDATACCAQGLEFELAGDYSYPEDYPAVNTDVIVSGTFDTYEEEGYTYITLRNAKFE